MEPVPTETLRDDTEFDLDVRLEAVARHLSAEPAKKPSEGQECGTQYSCVQTCAGPGCG